jgi:hypothetical protein
LIPTQLFSPPRSGGDGPDAEAEAGQTIGTELHTTSVTFPRYTLPNVLAPYFAASGVKTGDKLSAALQASWIDNFCKVTLKHAASNGPARDSSLLYSSGGCVFEWRDEWWKGNETYAYFHSVSGNQQCAVPSCPPSNCSHTGAANVVFPGGWGDEEWFGVTGAKANGRQNSAPVVDMYTGKLNGGPDILEPRAAFAALWCLFSSNPVRNV